MKGKLLCCALVAGLAMANSASAQSYDDRWYFAAGGGVGFFDNDRNVDHELYGNIGFGKFVSPNISVDLELWHSNPELDYNFNEERNWELMSLALVGRYHFGDVGEGWHPYFALGIGAQEHHDGTQVIPLVFGFNESRVGTDTVAIAGLGMQGDVGWAHLRAEIGARFDMDDGGLDDGHYTDGYAGLTVLFPFGHREEAVVVAPAPAPPAKTCADLDDDGDGVNNCDDRCPGSTAGQAMGSDGCPVPAPAPEPAPEPKPYRN